MEKKVFKSYRQLISLLRNRGINIKKGSAGSRVIRILEKENYYNVINGYKELFIDRSASKTISVNDVLDVMGFPDNWKNILITY